MLCKNTIHVNAWLELTNTVWGTIYSTFSDQCGFSILGYQYWIDFTSFNIWFKTAYWTFVHDLLKACIIVIKTQNTFVFSLLQLYIAEIRLSINNYNTYRYRFTRQRQFWSDMSVVKPISPSLHSLWCSTYNIGSLPSLN